MEKRQLENANMLKTVRNFLTTDTNQPIWAGVPVIVQLVEELEGRVKLIDSLTQKQESPTNGVTADKGQVEDLLIDSTMVVSGILRGFAAREKNAVLLAKVKVTRSGLRDLADGKLPEVATAIRELAAEREEALADYGLKPTHLTELESRTAAYEAVVMAPRNAIVSRTTLTRILKDEVRAAANLLREVLDHLMPQFEDERPDFVAEYEVARRIVSLPTRKRNTEEVGEGTTTEAQAPDRAESVHVVRESEPATEEMVLTN